MDGRRTDRGRHEGISRRDGADASAWSINFCETALLRCITSEEAALNPRTNARGKAGGNIWEVETLVGSTRSDRLGRSGGRNGDLLEGIVAEVAGDGRTLLLVRRRHEDEDGQKHE